MKLSAYFFFFSASAFAAGPALPPELDAFLGKPPASYKSRFFQPAKKLREAMSKLEAGKKQAALAELSLLAGNGEMAEHASYELAALQRDLKEFAKSTETANRFLYAHPSTPYRSLAENLIQENDCDLGLAKARAANGPASRAAAAALLQRCLERTPWREWADREQQAEALYQLLKKGKDPLLGSLVAELIQALPSTSPLRSKLQKEIPSEELNSYASVARFRTSSSQPPGVRAVNPDADLFEQGITAVLENRWADAGVLFKQMAAEYPQSEHMDRANYWIARTEEATGNEEEARRRYGEIFSRDPLSYYGLQSALRTSRDPSLLIVPAETKPEPMKGTLLLQQALSVWRLKALLESGLIDQARMEAKALFQYRPGGFTFGQESASGAALAALLYHSAGFSLAAFSHAYAAISLEAGQLNTFTLDLLFPSAFPKQFDSAAETSGVHPLLLASVAKQESAFLPHAVSRANALGVMQLLLSTARDVEPGVSKNQLFEPGTNLQIGARYLQKLLERFDGNIALALAGYNAGPSRASQWQKKLMETELMKKGFDVDAFIDSIPFTETRKYVASILRNYAWYKMLNKDGKIESIKELAFQWQKPQKEIPPSPAAQAAPKP